MWLVLTVVAAAGCGTEVGGEAPVAPLPSPVPTTTVFADGATLSSHENGADWCDGNVSALSVRVVASVGHSNGDSSKKDGLHPLWNEPVLDTDEPGLRDRGLFVDVRASCGTGDEFRVGAERVDVSGFDLDDGTTTLAPFGSVSSLALSFGVDHPSSSDEKLVLLQKSRRKGGGGSGGSGSGSGSGGGGSVGGSDDGSSSGGTTDSGSGDGTTGIAGGAGGTDGSGGAGDVGGSDGSGGAGDVGGTSGDDGSSDSGGYDDGSSDDGSSDDGGYDDGSSDDGGGSDDGSSDDSGGYDDGSSDDGSSWDDGTCDTCQKLVKHQRPVRRRAVRRPPAAR
jgi:hypothetical protein